ncbi:MAG: PIN domain-containing protein [Solirubrobacterales bacterium]
MAVILDSDAVVGFLDRNDGLHKAADGAVRDLAHGHRLLVSVVTYAEVLTGAHLGHHDEDQVRGFFSRLISDVLPVEVRIAERAAELRSHLKSLRMPDALILATADTEPEVDLILTGDKQAGRIPGLDCQVRLLA